MKQLVPILFSVILLLTSYTSVKAQYIINEADAKYELLDYSKAIDLYKQAYKKKATLYAAGRLASCYSLVENYNEAESWYALVVKMPGSKPGDMLNYARALQNNAKYNDAKEAYIKYAAMDSLVSPAQKDIWILSCDSAEAWMKTPRHVLINNLKTLNSEQSDWGAVAYGKGVVFASDRANSHSTAKISRPFLRFDHGKVPDKKVYGWTGNSYLRLYEQSEKSGAVRYFPATVRADYHVGPASFTADGKEMYFTLTRIPKKAEYAKGSLTTVNVEIYSCKKDTGGNWTIPVAFKYNRVSEYSVGDPCISKDGTTLYFVSNMPGGKGGTDIYYCRKNDAGEWDGPVNLVEINTNGNERTPAFDNDNGFYFSSDGRVGMGGLDIFKSIVVNSKFSTPVNMGYPINSPQDDFAYNLKSPDSSYFASNRSGGLGSDDIYQAVLQKPQIFKLDGIAYDKATKKPIANAMLSLTKNGEAPLKLQTDTDGRFQFNIETNSEYTLNGEKAGFRSEATNLSTVNLTGSASIKTDIYFEKIVLNKEIVLANIYYDFDKSDIRPDAAKELDRLVKILNDNPAIWIELGSHTDSRGGDQYNLWLSRKRANAAVQYMINRGISKSRILAKGYGAQQLLNGCIIGVKCTEAEHQVNRRTEFKITKQ